MRISKVRAVPPSHTSLTSGSPPFHVTPSAEDSSVSAAERSSTTIPMWNNWADARARSRRQRRWSTSRLEVDEDGDVGNDSSTEIGISHVASREGLPREAPPFVETHELVFVASDDEASIA